MALADILAAIIAQTDQKITEARTEHQKSVTKMREESERKASGFKQQLQKQKEQKKQQLHAKAVAHGESKMRNATLEKKQELLDRMYEKVAKELGSLSDSEIEPLLRACVKQIKAKGVIHPAEKHANLLKKICPSEQFRIEGKAKASGGFLFVSEKQEEDYTFEHLVQETLRPQTELETAQALFSS